MFPFILPALLAMASPSAPPLVTAALEVGAASTPSTADRPVTLTLRVAPGWHIYWLHPGDAGMPTRVQWTAPAGGKVEGPAWPAPHRFQEESGYQAFGYSGDVVLPATASGKIATGELVADVTYLACKDECIRGKTSARARLDASSAGVADAWKKAMATTPEALKGSDPFILQVQHEPGSATESRLSVAVVQTDPAVTVTVTEVFPLVGLEYTPGSLERIDASHARTQVKRPDGSSLPTGQVVVLVTLKRNGQPDETVARVFPLPAASAPPPAAASERPPIGTP